MFWQQIINGLTLGAIYTLVALGYSLIMGYLGILNIAVSEVFMASAFIGWTLLSHGIGIWLAFPVAAAAAGGISLLIEFVGCRPFLGADALMPLLSTIALSIVIDTVVANVWGSTPLSYPARALPSTLGQSLRIGSLSLSFLQLFTMAAAVVLCLLLTLLVRRTQFGRAVRAVGENRDAAGALGISVPWITSITFALSGVLAGAAGLLVGLSAAAINPSLGQDFGLQAIAVMVVGGVDNAWGAVVAGPLIGVAQALTTGYLSASYNGYVIYGLFILVLLFRPQGILGGRSLQARF